MASILHLPGPTKEEQDYQRRMYRLPVAGLLVAIMATTATIAAVVK